MVLADGRVTETIHEQQSDRDLSLGGGVHAEHQTYRYDAAGRLTAVQDSINGSCTIRTYRFGDATNQFTTSLSTGADQNPRTAENAR